MWHVFQIDLTCFGIFITLVTTVLTDAQVPVWSPPIRQDCAQSLPYGRGGVERRKWRSAPC